MFQLWCGLISNTTSLPSPPLPGPECLSASDFLRWRQDLKCQGGEPGAVDWLLDAAAGVSPAHLQALLLRSAPSVRLRTSRRGIERLWRRHLEEAVPLQYLIGRCFWRDLELEVGPGVLIPRPETEALIDLAVALLTSRPPMASDGLRWADLGTGSGCLAMGLARAFAGSHGLAVDVSPGAVSQARRNLLRAGLLSRVRLIQGDWFAAVAPWWGHLHLVLANPPYIPSDEVDRLDPMVRDHEPRLALDGGADGLASIRRLAMVAREALAPGGWLLLEHHHDQSGQVSALLACHGLEEIQSHPDLEGHRRFISGRRPLSPPPPPPIVRARP